MKFADVDTARNAHGVRLVVVGATPSPWSEGARGLFAAKGIDGMLVRFTAKDEAVKGWTGWHNAPVLFVDDDPPRMHWSDILEAAERMGALKLVPPDADERTRTFGLAHEILGEEGLAWSGRLALVHRNLRTEGREGFPVRLAHYLGGKYGCSPERAETAKVRVIAILKRFDDILTERRAEGSRYLLGSLTAVDIYVAATIGLFTPLSPEQCHGVHPIVRKAFESTDEDILAAVTPSLRAHRDFIYEEHIGLPIDV